MQRDIPFKDIHFIIQVDDEDMDILLKSWRISFKNKHANYHSVRRTLRKSELVAGRPASVKLHNEVWEKHFGPIPPGHEIDHFNYDTCDNRKENLRLLTKLENNKRNRKPRSKDGQPMDEAA